MEVAVAGQEFDSRLEVGFQIERDEPRLIAVPVVSGVSSDFSERYLKRWPDRIFLGRKTKCRGSTARIALSGELISGFMKRIALADRVIVVLSEKYLRSPYSMTEGTRGGWSNTDSSCGTDFSVLTSQFFAKMG